MVNTLTETEKNRVIGLVMAEIGKLNLKIEKYKAKHISTEILENAVNDYKSILNKI
jgi:hypothetical protein